MSPDAITISEIILFFNSIITATNFQVVSLISAGNTGLGPQTEDIDSDMYY